MSAAVRVDNVRPASGTRVVMMFISRDSVEMADGTVLHNRGRGIVIESDSAPSPAPTPGSTVMLSFCDNGTTLCSTMTIDEVLTGTRFYLHPVGETRPLEAREFLREVYTVPWAAGMPGSVPERVPAAIELSGSGFRFLVEPEFRVGDVIAISMEAMPGAVLELTGCVLRSSERLGRWEVAGRFVDMKPADRDVLLESVFRASFRKLGLADTSA